VLLRITGTFDFHLAVQFPGVNYVLCHAGFPRLLCTNVLRLASLSARNINSLFNETTYIITIICRFCFM